MGRSSYSKRSLSIYQHLITILMTFVVVCLVFLLGFVIWKRKYAYVPPPQVPYTPPKNKASSHKASIGLDDIHDYDLDSADEQEDDTYPDDPEPKHDTSHKKATQERPTSTSLSRTPPQPQIQPQLRHQLHDDMERRMQTQQQARRAGPPPPAHPQQLGHTPHRDDPTLDPPIAPPVSTSTDVRCQNITPHSYQSPNFTSFSNATHGSETFDQFPTN